MSLLREERHLLKLSWTLVPRWTRQNLRNSIGTALQWAASNGSFETVELLLDRCADVNASPGWKGTALIAAVRSKSRNVVALLLSHGADPNQLDLYHCASPLSAADDIEIIELLLDYGADVDYSPLREQHVLIKAVEANCRLTVRLLLQHGADANMSSKNVSTIGWVIRSEYLGVAIELVEHSATFHNRHAGSLVALSLVHGNAELLQAMVHHGVDPLSLDLPLGCPLLYAASVGRLDLIGILLNFGADLNCRHHKHRPVISAALQNGHKRAVDWLSHKGAEIPNALYWESVPEVTPQLALWKCLALRSTYDGSAEFLVHYENAGTRIPITSFEFPWHIPLLLYERRQSSISSSIVLQSHVVLVRWDTKDGDGKDIIRTEALTCLEYVQRRWGTLGSQVLGDIGLLATRDDRTVFQRCMLRP
jgi:ankyrin repeat protein